MLFSGGGAANGLNVAGEADAVFISAGVLTYQFNGSGYPAGGIPLAPPWATRSLYLNTTDDRIEHRATDIMLQNVYAGTGLGADITDMVLVFAQPGANYQALARWDLGATYTLSASAPASIAIVMPATGLVRHTIS